MSINQELHDEVTRLRAENAALRSELASALRYGRDTETLHNDLGNLYVLIHGLFATPEREVVRAVVRDVLINFVGTEEVACYERDGDVLRLAWQVGVELPEQTPLTETELGQACLDGAIRVMTPAELQTRRRDQPSAIVPMRLSTPPSEIVGAVVIFGLLPQRPHYGDLDQQIFKILSTHGAVALWASAG